MTCEEYRIKDITSEERIEHNKKRNKLFFDIKEKAMLIEGYEKLTKAQKQVIDNLVAKMYYNFVGVEVIYNNYEIFNDNSIKNPEYKKYRDMEDNNEYLAMGSTATFKALEKKGFILFLRDGKSWVDIISPQFTIDFTDITF